MIDHGLPSASINCRGSSFTAGSTTSITGSIFQLFQLQLQVFVSEGFEAPASVRLLEVCSKGHKNSRALAVEGGTTWNHVEPVIDQLGKFGVLLYRCYSLL